MMPPWRCPHFGTAPAAGIVTLGAGAWHFDSVRVSTSVIDCGGGGDSVSLCVRQAMLLL